MPFLIFHFTSPGSIIQSSRNENLRQEQKHEKAPHIACDHRILNLTIFGYYNSVISQYYGRIFRIKTKPVEQNQVFVLRLNCGIY